MTDWKSIFLIGKTENQFPTDESQFCFRGHRQKRFYILPFIVSTSHWSYAKIKIQFMGSAELISGQMPFFDDRFVRSSCLWQSMNLATQFRRGSARSLFLCLAIWPMTTYDWLFRAAVTIPHTKWLITICPFNGFHRFSTINQDLTKKCISAKCASTDHVAHGHKWHHSHPSARRQWFIDIYGQ